MTSPRNNGNNETMNGNKEGGEIDREKVCPLLLRVFCATSRHNNLLDYNRGKRRNHKIRKHSVRIDMTICL